MKEFYVEIRFYSVLNQDTPFLEIKTEEVWRGSEGELYVLEDGSRMEEGEERKREDEGFIWKEEEIRRKEERRRREEEGGKTEEDDEEEEEEEEEEEVEVNEKVVNDHRRRENEEGDEEDEGEDGVEERKKVEEGNDGEREMHLFLFDEFRMELVILNQTNHLVEGVECIGKLDLTSHDHQSLEMVITFFFLSPFFLPSPISSLSHLLYLYICRFNITKYSN